MAFFLPKSQAFQPLIGEKDNKIATQARKSFFRVSVANHTKAYLNVIVCWRFHSDKQLFRLNILNKNIACYQ